MWEITNIGGGLQVVNGAAAVASVPASATGATVGTTGYVFDRRAFQNFRSGFFVANLFATDTVGLTYNQVVRTSVLVEDATASGGTFSAVPQPGSTAGIAYGNALGQGTATGTFNSSVVGMGVPFHLSGARRYVRVTPRIETHVYNTTASASGIITVGAGVLVLGGGNFMPSTGLLRTDGSTTT